MFTLISMALIVLSQVPPNFEIEALALAHDVNPALALAVAEQESGNSDVWRKGPQAGRHMISRTGDHGRFQINCFYFQKETHLPCGVLANRHLNMYWGVRKIASIQRKRGGHYTRPPVWIGHYNSGGLITSRGAQYARQVISRMNRITREGSSTLLPRYLENQKKKVSRKKTS